MSFTEILIFNTNSINPDHVPRSVASDLGFTPFAYWVSSCKKGEVGGFKHNTYGLHLSPGNCTVKATREGPDLTAQTLSQNCTWSASKKMHSLVRLRLIGFVKMCLCHTFKEIYKNLCEQ